VAVLCAEFLIPPLDGPGIRVARGSLQPRRQIGVLLLQARQRAPAQADAVAEGAVWLMALVDGDLPGRVPPLQQPRCREPGGTTAQNANLDLRHLGSMAKPRTDVNACVDEQT
jgi:hypothetical protein